jgi:hypothetical protein
VRWIDRRLPTNILAGSLQAYVIHNGLQAGQGWAFPQGMDYSDYSFWGAGFVGNGLVH